MPVFYQSGHVILLIAKKDTCSPKLSPGLPASQVG